MNRGRSLLLRLLLDRSRDGSGSLLLLLLDWGGPLLLLLLYRG